MKIIRQCDFTATPWRNGGGITQEAIRVPTGGGPFRWRVSVARIERSGPFSDFAAYNRKMVLLQGGGVALNLSNGERHVLRKVGDLAEFDGALKTQCELLRGPCVDLNLMAAKTLEDVHARVEHLRRPLSLTVERDRSMLVFPIDAAVDVQFGGDTAVLEPWDLAMISHSSGKGGNLAPRAPFAAASVFLATLPDA